MRILLASTRGAGHVGPLLPFAHAWRRAGHELLLAVPPGAVAQVEREGLPHRAFEAPAEEELAPVWARVLESTPDDANRHVVSEIFARLNTSAALPGMLETIEAWNPDVVIRETAEFASSLAAERHGVPQARVATGLAAFETWALEFVACPIDELRGRLGLPRDPQGGLLRDSAYLTLAPAALEDPAAPLEEARRFSVGREPAEAAWRGQDDRPLVFVSFGSEAPNMDFFPSLYRGVVDALADQPARVLMAIGSEGRDPADLGPLPENARVERWIPQSEVMPVAAAMIGHGGFGSTLKALGAGVPQVLMPLFAEQPLNARRVAAVGAGIALEGGPAALGGLAEAVTRMLEDPSFDARAERLASEMSALPSVDESVALLDEIAAGSRA